MYYSICGVKGQIMFSIVVVFNIYVCFYVGKGDSDAGREHNDRPMATANYGRSGKA